MSGDRVLLAGAGDQIVLSVDGLRVNAGVTSGVHMMLHGNFLGPDRGVLAERRIVGDQGFVMVTVVVDFETGEQVCDPWLESRGWLDADDATSVGEEIVAQVGAAIDEELAKSDWDRSGLVRRVRRTTGGLVNQRSRRRPMIVPVVIDV
jgi:ribonuclease J